MISYGEMLEPEHRTDSHGCRMGAHQAHALCCSLLPHFTLLYLQSTSNTQCQPIANLCTLQTDQLTKFNSAAICPQVRRHQNLNPYLILSGNTHLWVKQDLLRAGELKCVTNWHGTNAWWFLGLANEIRHTGEMT